MTSSESTKKSCFPSGFQDDVKFYVWTVTPLLFVSLSQMVIPIVSLMYCGSLGVNELGGVALSISIINIIVIVSSSGLASACDTLFPQLYGGNEKKLMGVVLQKALLISILTSLADASLLLLSSYIIDFLTKKPEISQVANDFNLYYVPSVFSMNLVAVLSRYIQSQNVVYPLLVINLLGIGLNILLHQTFMVWMNMGLIGSSISINITGYFILLGILAYIYISKIYVNTWTEWSFECLLDWRMYLRLAIPGLFAVLIECSNFEIGILVSPQIDAIQLALMGIAIQVTQVIFQLGYAIGVASNIRVGQFLGANRPKEAKNAAKVSYIIIASETILTGISLVIFSKKVASLFTKNQEELVESAADLLKVVAILHIFDSFQGNNNGIMRSLGAQLYSTVMYFGSFYLAGVPFGLALMFLTPLKSKGFLIGSIIGLIFLNIFQMVYLVRLDWKKKALQIHQAVMNSEERHELIVQKEITNNNTNDNNNETRETRSRKKTYFLKGIISILFFVFFFTILFFRLYKHIS